MTIKEQLNGVSLVLFVEGRLDTNTAPILEKRIKEYFSCIIELTLNLSAVEYMSSAGLRVILATQKMAGTEKRVIIKSPSAFCMQVFEATGMAGILNIKR